MKNSIKMDPVTSFNSSGLSGTLQVINPSGFGGPAVLVRLVNDSSVPVAVSFDGLRAHDYLPKGSTLELNLQTNAGPNNWAACMKTGTKVYVSGSSGSGFLYLAVYYQEQ